MRSLPIYEMVIFLFLGLAACGLEREVEIELPVYESKAVVECYLEPGRPYRLLLSRSEPYFSPFPTAASEFLNNLLIDNAEVIIRHQGNEYRLRNQLVLDGEINKIYNYSNDQRVPFDYDDDFELFITLPGGETITAITRLLPPIPIDSVRVEFNETDTLARVLTYFTDPSREKNFYRRMLHYNSLDSIPEQDFTLDDRFVEDVVVFGSAYDYLRGDTVFNTLFHIDRPYYDFLESLNAAIISNGNPFGQPSPIISNLEGSASAIGIFTGLSFVREQTIIE